jgi:subtilisin family serine protease
LGASGTRASTAAAWALARIDASGAWALVGTHQLPTVAILDTGIDSAHPDLAGKVAAARDFVDGSGDTSDVSWHGTAVAGVVAGGSVESGTSVCPTCTIISAKVLDAEETGSDPEIARGLLWAVGAGVRVVNLSLSGPDEAPVLRAAIRTATKRGVVIVAAAGNGGSTDRTFPAADPGVIGVAATTSSDSLFDWSNRGPWVSIAAPGETATTLRGGGYTTFLGTSAAAPAVAAAAAECLSVAPQLGPAAVRRILMQTADPVAGMTFGRLNVARAVDACSKA